MLTLPQYARAPFIAPGRRNRKVHWNRALAKAIESLGSYEREDWRQSLWLPKALRGFYPKWFASKNKAGCGCCGSFDPCSGCEDCYGGGTPTEAEVDLPAFTNSDGDCTGCGTIAGTYILTLFSTCVYAYTDIGTSICSATTNFTISLTAYCVDGKCYPEGRVLVNRAALEIQNSFWNVGSLSQPTPITHFKYSDLPWSLTYVGEGGPFPTHVNCTPDGNPFVVNSFA